MVKIKEEIEPFLSTMDLPLQSGSMEEPGKAVYIFAKVSNNEYNEHSEIAGYFLPFKENGKQFPGSEGLWLGGMQKWVVHNVYIVTDDPDEGIYSAYHVMNDTNSLTYLAKLKDGHHYTERFRQAFKEFKV